MVKPTFPDYLLIHKRTKKTFVIYIMPVRGTDHCADDTFLLCWPLESAVKTKTFLDVKFFANARVTEHFIIKIRDRSNNCSCKTKYILNGSFKSHSNWYKKNLIITDINGWKVHVYYFCNDATKHNHMIIYSNINFIISFYCVSLFDNFMTMYHVFRHEVW